jgi:hypothetical protein
MGANGTIGNSHSDFLAYHCSFTGPTGRPVYHAVITYPGGVNGSIPSLPNPFDGMTEATSHELAESVTYPAVGKTGSFGWLDYYRGEIGDITNQRYVYLNGYAVQRIANSNDQAMTPAGATAATSETLVLLNGGYLFEHTPSGWTYLTPGVSSVGDQGIDNRGRAMIDVVLAGGAAFEYHDGWGWTYLGSGVQSAKAGQGVSYVLFYGGQLWEYKDADATWGYIYSGVKSIDAGTDRLGVNMVDVVFPWGDAWEHSDSTGWHYLGSGVQAVSAGRQGISDILFTNTAAYWYSEAGNLYVYLGSNVIQVMAGTDQSGGYAIDLVFTCGPTYNLWEGGSWSYLGSGIQSMGKARAGVLDALFAGGLVYEYDGYSWGVLTSGVLQAV